MVDEVIGIEPDADGRPATLLLQGAAAFLW
jgi:hypothetical protein